MINQQLDEFTDEQIRDKAHRIWLARQESGEPGNEETDWQAAVKALSSENSKESIFNHALRKWFWLGMVVALSLLILLGLSTFGPLNGMLEYI